MEIIARTGNILRFFQEVKTNPRGFNVVSVLNLQQVITRNIYVEATSTFLRLRDRADCQQTVVNLSVSSRLNLSHFAGPKTHYLQIFQNFFCWQSLRKFKYEAILQKLNLTQQLSVIY